MKLIKKQIKKHINIAPRARGIRVALGYMKQQEKYLGYFLGYCGGGVQCDAYFKISNQFEELLIFCENSKIWKKLSEKEQKILYLISDNTKENMVFDDSICFWKLPKERYKSFDEYNQNSIKHYYFESENFKDEILTKLSQKWALLTSYYLLI
jgi:hypothetical protein